MRVLMNNLSYCVKLHAGLMYFLFIVLSQASIGELIAAEDEAAPSKATETIHQLEVSFADVGIVYQYSAISANVVLINTSADSVRIDRIESSQKNAGATIKFVPHKLMPGDSTTVRFTLPGSDNVGLFAHIFYAYSNEQAKPIAKIAIRGFADWMVDPSSLSLDLGLVNYKESFQKKLFVESRPGTEVRITSILQKSSWIKADITDGGRSITLTADPKMPWGLFDETILLGTDNGIQSRASVHVRGEVRGAVVPSTNAIDFSIIREGQSAEQAVRLEDVANTRLRIGRVSVSGMKANTRIEECTPISALCKILKIDLPEQKLGEAPRGVLRIAFPDYDAELPIPFGGSVIGKNTVIRDLNKELEISASSQRSVTSALNSAVNAPKPVEMPAPVGRGPLLKWEMANEGPIFGYEIYRSKSLSGPFARANDEIISKLSNGPAGTSIYRWRDLHASAGEEYWYYIGVVYSSGRKEVLNTPQRVVAK